MEEFFLNSGLDVNEYDSWQQQAATSIATFDCPPEAKYSAGYGSSPVDGVLTVKTVHSCHQKLQYPMSKGLKMTSLFSVCNQSYPEAVEYFDWITSKESPWSSVINPDIIRRLRVKNIDIFEILDSEVANKNPALFYNFLTATRLPNEKKLQCITWFKLVAEHGFHKADALVASGLVNFEGGNYVSDNRFNGWHSPINPTHFDIQAFRKGNYNSLNVMTERTGYGWANKSVKPFNPKPESKEVKTQFSHIYAIDIGEFKEYFEKEFPIDA